jgi:hypothetical protein
MVGHLRFAVAAALSLLLTACAGDSDRFSYLGSGDGFVVGSDEAEIETPNRPMQCVPFARNRSGVIVYGDAADWWDRAAGRYERSDAPRLGAVLVLTGYAGPHHGHLAVVTAVDSSRQIRVDHANWMNDGRIYRNDPVVDVSPDNDWSEVRVWDTRDQVLGSRIYPVQGFIGPSHPHGQTDRIASLN